VVAAFEAQGVTCRMLPVDYAFHSPQMAGAARGLAERLRDLAPAAVNVPLASTVTGRGIDPSTMDARYWARNVESAVQFRAAVDTLIEQEITLFVEIGPHPVLGAAIAQCLERHGREGLTIASLRRGQDERALMLAPSGCSTPRACRWTGRRFRGLGFGPSACRAISGTAGRTGSWTRLPVIRHRRSTRCRRRIGIHSSETHCALRSARSSPRSSTP